MQNMLTLDALTSLLALTFMEILLGIDNVIFVSIIMGRISEKHLQKRASLYWMFAGIIIRILLLFFLTRLIDKTENLFSIFNHPISLKDIITFGGGIFLMINSTLEIHNKLEGDDQDATLKNERAKTFRSIVIQIIIIDLVFSFDGIITAIGMVANNMFPVRIIAVLISMGFMFFFAGRISSFIHKHPTFKILALSFLLLIGFLLMIEGINVEQIKIPHGYIYFAMAFSFGIELLNMKLRKKSHPVELKERNLRNND